MRFKLKSFDFYTSGLIKESPVNINYNFWRLNDKLSLISSAKFSSRAQISMEINVANRIFNIPFKFKD